MLTAAPYNLAAGDDVEAKVTAYCLTLASAGTTAAAGDATVPA